MHDILIVGAGHAGAQAAIGLRQRGFSGTITLVGEEPDLPYERPPLSKDYLAGAKSFERLLLRPESFWAERDIALQTGRRVEAVDAARNFVATSDGSRMSYGKLVWAAGGAARRLACKGSDLQGVHSVRTRSDVDAIRSELGQARRVVIAGGGYVGLETAAVLVKLGKSVTVVEAQERVLARVAGVAISRFYETEHRRRGVDLRLGTSVERLEGENGRVTSIRCADGLVIPCDLLLVGIGIDPAIAPLLAAGAEGGNGVVVDEYCRTSLPDIFAIGDCAAHVNRFAGGAVIRLESVQNANDQAMTVAKLLTGCPEPYDSVPWFWSNQFELRLQTVGLSAGYDTEVVRGDPATGSFSVIYLRNGAVIALDCVNAARDFVQGRAFVTGGTAVPEQLLTDSSVALKDMLCPAD